MTGKIKFLRLPLSLHTNMGCPAAPAPVPAAGTRVSPPKSPSTPPECGQTFVAASDTTVRPVRPPSALGNPSPATDLSSSTRPYAPFFSTPQIRNLPECGQTFVAVSDTTVRPMRPLSDTKNFTTATIVAASATNTLARPLFSQLQNPSECDQTFVAGSDTTMRPVRPWPPHSQVGSVDLWTWLIIARSPKD